MLGIKDFFFPNGTKLYSLLFYFIRIFFVTFKTIRAILTFKEKKKKEEEKKETERIKRKK